MICVCGHHLEMHSAIARHLGGRRRCLAIMIERGGASFAVTGLSDPVRRCECRGFELPPETDVQWRQRMRLAERDWRP